MPVIIAIIATALLAVGTVASFPAGRRMLAALIGHAMIAGLWMIQHAAPAIAEEVMAVLVTGLAVAKPTVLRAAGVLLQELTGQEINLEQISQQTLSEFMGAAAPGPDSALVRGILDAMAPAGDLTPEQGLTNLSRLFLVRMSTGLQAWVISLLADALDLGKLRTLGEFHAAVDASLGFRRLGMLMWRGPIQAGITKPVTEYYNRLYHPTLPSPAQLVTGWQKGIYPDDVYLDRMRSHGYGYEVAQQLLTVHEKEIALADVATLYKRGQITTDVLGQILKHQGYADEQAGLITTWLDGGQSDTLLKEIAGQARALYKAGDIAEDEYRSLLEQAHWRADEIGLALAADQLALRAEKNLTVTEIVNAMKEQLYSEDEARGALRKMRYTDPVIDVLFGLQKKQLTAAQVVDLFTRGQRTRQASITALTKLGYLEADAEGLLDLRTKTLTEGQVLDALGKQLINVQDATQALLRLGYTQEAVDILLAFQRKTLSAAEVQAAIVRELLTPAQGLEKLMAIGYSRDDAQLLVELRFRLMSVGQILDAYADGLLTRVDAIADLGARGLSTEDARTVVTVFDLRAQAALQKKAAAKRPPAAPPPPPAPAGP